MDLLPLSTQSIGGNDYILIFVDEKCSFVSGIALKTKSTKSIYDGLSDIIAFYNSYEYKVMKITTDDDNYFVATSPLLEKCGVQMCSTPADLHESRCERYIKS